MNSTLDPASETSMTQKWRLWIDGCGGFELTRSPRWIVGGARPSGLPGVGSVADIQVQSDWRRLEGQIFRRDGRYLWQPHSNDSFGDARLLTHGQAVPVPGSAKMVFSQPSPLSTTATLQLNAPHRFANHIDGVILVDQTILLGPGSGNHIQSAAHDCDVVMVLRNGTWQAKVKSPNRETQRSQRAPIRSSSTRLVDLIAGQRVSVGEMDMTLEKV